MGLNDCHNMPSHTLTAINNEIPDPNPYPSYNISSNNITITPAKNNYNIISITVVNPILSISPYIPLYIYANASHAVIINDNNLLECSYIYLSFSFYISKSIIFTPTINYITIPAVITGDIPNSINVPLLLANITLTQ